MNSRNLMQTLCALAVLGYLLLVPGTAAGQSAATIQSSTGETLVDVQENGDMEVQGAISGFGVVPIGSIVAWHKNLFGTPSLLDGWVECNGQVVDDPESPYDGQTLPDLNGEKRFLRGGATSGEDQSDALRSHPHDFSATTDLKGSHHHSIDGNFAKGGGDYDRDHIGSGLGFADYTEDAGNHTHPVSGRTDHFGGEETRPVNMSVVWIMRIK